jgi:hypothetical protein
MTGLLRRNPALLTLAEFWLSGMEHRGINPLAVLSGYQSMGHQLAVLGADGSARVASDAEIIDACEAWAGRYVNLVLAGPTAPLPA